MRECSGFRGARERVSMTVQRVSLPAAGVVTIDKVRDGAREY
jgi:hypothetical protein